MALLQFEYSLVNCDQNDTRCDNKFPGMAIPNLIKQLTSTCCTHPGLIRFYCCLSAIAR